MGELEGGRRVDAIFLRRVNDEVYGSNNAIYILCVFLASVGARVRALTPTSLADGRGKHEALAVL